MSYRFFAGAAALWLACAPLAHAVDKVEPTELEIGDAKIRQAVAAPDGSAVFLLEGQVDEFGRAAKKEGAAKVLVWDAAKKKLDGEIKIPKGAVHMGVTKDKLIVACAESEAVVIVDIKTRKISKTVETEIKGENIPPHYVVPDPPAGKAVVLCQKEGTAWWDVFLVEIDLGSGKLVVLTKAGVQHAAFAKDSVITQGNFGGSPSGGPEFWKLSSMRKSGDKNQGPGAGAREPGERGKSARNWHSSFAPFRAVNDGANLVTADEQGKIVLFSPDCTKELWAVDGSLYAIHPTKPVILGLASAGDRGVGDTKELTIMGLNSQSGRRMWRFVVPLEGTVDGWALHSSRALNNPPTILPGKPDQLIFALPIRDRKAGRETGPKWFRVDLPGSEGGTGPTVGGAEPPSEAKAGEAFDWTPKTSNVKEGTTFILKQSPEGMTIDAKTGKLTWKPDDTHLGKHDVEIVAKVGPDEIPLVSFTIRVRAKGEKGEKGDKPEKGK
ncbi:MAG: hypothetical protein ACAI25_07545 [Planctomycetota bacterium]